LNLPSDSIFPDQAYLPLLIFVAETSVLTLATVRTICIARGKKGRAALLGFFEVSIWLFAVDQVMQHLSNLSCAMAFAAGFSLGNYLGVLIEQKLAHGKAGAVIGKRKGIGALLMSLRSVPAP